ncbi:hypothetical protein N7541_008038 [Penicillium brevicompactum]|uniref:Uncharacterized protein n=1 Tax=Penicillium brevicompactum TaxID=5074 RepID=A0A9W9QY98_PENBR|nr:uncharacterized protein N7506_000134 [Penicillium brevicompactum]KAJ5346881.1 hypothetical protein N7506_000134 [Penicillium brevicompactum]KAJ5350311.1 hypothetical protein N7541_008038 [Penicillium brevicompactum]
MATFIWAFGDRILNAAHQAVVVTGEERKPSASMNEALAMPIRKYGDPPLQPIFPAPRRVSPACGILDNSVLRGFIIYPPPKRSHSSHYPLLCGQVAYGPNAQRTECRSSAAVRTSPRLILSHRRALHANSRRRNIPNLPCAWAPERGLSDTA